jgi:PiT family inorganic phosphate transporter
VGSIQSHAVGAADWFGLPVSTTHVLFVRDCGNHGGEPFRPAMGDRAQLGHGVVLTLPASMVLAGFLFWGFRNLF